MKGGNHVKLTQYFKLLVCVWMQIKKPNYYTIQLIFLLFMDPTSFFGTIRRSYCTISVNFYLYQQYFQQKNFSFSKLSGSQTDP